MSQPTPDGLKADVDKGGKGSRAALNRPALYAAIPMGRLVWLVCCLMLSASIALGAEPSRRHEKGRALYNYRCYFCHGYSGNAKTLAATYLTPPPADFTRADPARLTRDFIVGVLEAGRSGTAMKPFRGILKRDEMTSIAEFVVSEFVERKGVNTRYHTPENGWRDHLRYRKAFPFAKGEIPLSRSWESLTPDEAEGKHLYLSACVSCHDRGAMDPDDVTWDSRRFPVRAATDDAGGVCGAATKKDVVCIDVDSATRLSK